MDLINRYIYAVTKSLPEKQRPDIEKELRSLIDDMVDRIEVDEAYESKVQKVLVELGDPEILANNYRGTEKYLIGPKYYEQYMLVIKIVLGAVFTGISIAIFIAGIFSEQKSITDIFKDYISVLFSALFQAFAWTTIAFAVAERKSANLNKKAPEKNEWNPSKLPAIPEKKSVIPISEPIASMLFTTIFISILYSAPQLFSAYISKGGEMTVIPVFDLDIIKGYRAVLICVYLLGIFKDVLKLFGRKWTIQLSVAAVILSAASAVLMLVMLTDKGIWNPVFASELTKAMSLSFDFTLIWTKIRYWLVVLFAMGTVIDIIATLYKGFRFDLHKYSMISK